jgi:hypothetical protein
MKITDDYMSMFLNGSFPHIVDRKLNYWVDNNEQDEIVFEWDESIDL